MEQTLSACRHLRPRWKHFQRKAHTMMFEKAAAKLATRDTVVKLESKAPWAKVRRDYELLKKPHGPTVNMGRIPTARKAPLSFHKPSGRR